MQYLKFRVWDVERQKLFPVTEITMSWNNGVVYSVQAREKYGFAIIRRPFILEQYVGLKDKNGKEIYEGDIVEFSARSGGMTRKTVAFKQGMFVVEPMVLTLYGAFFESPKSIGVKVIGNIHENPELLEEKNARAEV